MNTGQKMRKTCLRWSSLWMIVGCLWPRTITTAGFSPLAIAAPGTPDKGLRTHSDHLTPDQKTHQGDQSLGSCQNDLASSRLCLSCALLPEELSLPVTACCEEAAARRLCALCLQWPQACLQPSAAGQRPVATGDDVMADKLSSRADKNADAEDVEEDWPPLSGRYSVLLAGRPPDRPVFHATDLKDADVDDSAFPQGAFDDVDSVGKGQGSSGSGPTAHYGRRGPRYAIRFSPTTSTISTPTQGRRGRWDKRWGTLWIGKARNWGRSGRGDYGKKWDDVQMEKRYLWTDSDQGRGKPNREQSPPGEFAVAIFDDDLMRDSGEEEKEGRWVDPENGWGPPVGDGELTPWSPQKRWGSLGLGKWRTQWGQATRRQVRSKRRVHGFLDNEEVASEGENEVESPFSFRHKQKDSRAREVQTLPERGAESDQGRGPRDKRWGWLGVSSHRRGSSRSRGTPRRVKRSGPSHPAWRTTPGLARDELSDVRDSLPAGRRQKRSQDLRPQSPPWHRRGHKASQRGQLEAAEAAPAAASQNHVPLGVQDAKSGQGWRKASEEATAAGGGNEEVDQELFGEKWAKLDVGHNSPENQHPYWRYKTGARG